MKSLFAQPEGGVTGKFCQNSVGDLTASRAHNAPLPPARTTPSPRPTRTAPTRRQTTHRPIHIVRKKSGRPVSSAAQRAREVVVAAQSLGGVVAWHQWQAADPIRHTLERHQFARLAKRARAASSGQRQAAPGEAAAAAATAAAAHMPTCELGARAQWVVGGHSLRALPGAILGARCSQHG